MGLMTEGTALTWEEIVAVRDLFRSHALSQLIRVYEKCKDRKGDCFMWGDEVGSSIQSAHTLSLSRILFLVGINVGSVWPCKQTCSIALEGSQALTTSNRIEWDDQWWVKQTIVLDFECRIRSRTCRIAWHPEACDYVVEGVPAEPYGYVPSYLNTVEANMALRREQTQKLLSKESDCEYILNISAFPL